MWGHEPPDRFNLAHTHDRKLGVSEGSAREREVCRRKPSDASPLQHSEFTHRERERDRERETERERERERRTEREKKFCGSYAIAIATAARQPMGAPPL